MGKITVNHFLNKAVKPIYNGNEKQYPLYVQVIFNQKNYKMRSNCNLFGSGGYLSEELFNNPLLSIFLDEEKKRITKTIRLLEDNNTSAELNSKNIQILSSTLYDLIDNRFWEVFVKEAKKVYPYPIPSFFYNATYIDINNMICFTRTEVAFDFSEEYQRLEKVASSICLNLFENKDIAMMTVAEFMYEQDKKELVIDLIKDNHFIIGPPDEVVEKEYADIANSIIDLAFLEETEKEDKAENKK